MCENSGLAGTYVKMQDAFISEKGDSSGTWIAIGYKAPGTVATAGTIDGGGVTSATNNFTYAENGGGSTTGSVVLGTAAEKWAASNKTKLNDCAAAKNWTLLVGANSASGAGAGEAVYTSTVGAGCVELTPAFTNIATTGAAAGSGS
ncbi:MAG: hypothetical protein LBR60_03720 [Fibrobacter sp.]|nr:hypothetical protein [Fibrobacter sp.]